MRQEGGHPPRPVGSVQVDEGSPGNRLWPVHVDGVLAAEVGLVDNLDTSRHHLIVGDSDAPQA